MVIMPTYTETEERIFEAAMRVFARKGKAGARMQEIADEAGINKAMLHYYFRSKDKLFEAVFDFSLRQFIASFGTAIQDAGTFADALRLFVNGYIDFVRNNTDKVRIMVGENLAGSSTFGQRLHKMMERGETTPPRQFIEKIVQAIEAGEIRAVDPFQTLFSTLSCCIFAFVMMPTVQTLNPMAAQDWDGFIEARKEHVFDLIYNGLAPRK